MWRLLISLIALLAAVWVGVTISKDPGYMLLVYRGWSMEMPLWFALFVLILFCVLLYFFLRLLFGIIHSWDLLTNWLRVRRKYRAYSKTNQGLLELIEGHFSSAEVLLLKGAKQTDFPLVNYLAAAKAAHERGAFDRRDKFLQKAHMVAPKAEIPIGIWQAEMLIEQGQLEQALVVLQRLQTLSPKHASVLKMLERLYIHLSDWDSLLRLLPTLRKARMIDKAYFISMESRVHQELLQATDNKTKDVDAIRRIWLSIPRKLRQQPELIYAYAKILLQYSYTSDEIEGLITPVLKNEWNKDLVELYGKLITSHPEMQLEQAEKWLKRYGDQAMLFLTLARISVRCQLLSKAKTYFEESLRFGANSEAYADYSKLLLQMGVVSL